jgi:peptidoglycan/xylan/chitin deacetylase (PgdA/CDA1 family)
MAMVSEGLRWPGERRIAVTFDVFVEGWSDGKAPGITPMGNPLPPAEGRVDTMAVSWAAYGVNAGIYRLMDALGSHGARANMVVSGVIAERSPSTVQEISRAGHEISSHSYAMDVIPVMLNEAAERANVSRCTQLLGEASGQQIKGWLSPRVTPSQRTEGLLAEAGYTWHGDCLDADLPTVHRASGRTIAALPFKTEVNDMPMVKHGARGREFLDAFVQNVDVLRGTSLASFMNVSIHSHIGGHAVPAHYFERVVAAAVTDPDIWVATRGEIAELAISSAQAN